jgi:hypothetical protein
MLMLTRGLTILQCLEERRCCWTLNDVATVSKNTLGQQPTANGSRSLAQEPNRTSCSEPVCMSLKMLIHTISSITDGLLLSNTNWTKWLPTLWIFARRILRQFNLEGSAQRRSLTARAVLPMCDHSESAKALYERISTLKHNWVGNAAEQEHYLHQQHRPRIAYEKPRWWKMIELLLSG